MCNGWYRTVLRNAAARNTLCPPQCPGPDLCGLLPLAVDADQTADGSGDTDNAIVKVDPGERRERNGQVAQVRDELRLAGSALPVKLLAPIDPGPGFEVYSHCDPLALDNALAILLINPGLPLLQLPKGVGLHDDTASQAHGPEPVGLLLSPLGALPLAHARGVEHRRGVEAQVARVPELPSHGHVLEDGVHGLGVAGDRGGLEVLDVFAEAHELADEAELLLQSGPGRDGGGHGVGAQQVPRVEAGEVLDDAEELIAAEGGGHVLEVMCHRGVVDDGVGDHGGRSLSSVGGYWIDGKVGLVGEDNISKCEKRVSVVGDRVKGALTRPWGENG